MFPSWCSSLSGILLRSSRICRAMQLCGGDSSRPPPRGLMHGISRRETREDRARAAALYLPQPPVFPSLIFSSIRCEHGIFFKGGDRAPHNQSTCILSVQEVSTVRPGSSAPILYSNLLNKTVHYFLDTQYVTHFM